MLLETTMAYALTAASWHFTGNFRPLPVSTLPSEAQRENRLLQCLSERTPRVDWAGMQAHAAEKKKLHAELHDKPLQIKLESGADHEGGPYSVPLGERTHE